MTETYPCEGGLFQARYAAIAFSIAAGATTDDEHVEGPCFQPLQIALT